MIIKLLTLGELQVNCYIIADEATKEAVIIDPGAEPETIKQCIALNKFNPLCIINTHGHADHIGANQFLKLPVYIHENDKDFLTDPHKNLSAAFGVTITSPPAAKLVRDGDGITVGTHTLRIAHTPGHTPGSISIQLDKAMLTGDALFYEGVGRTDFPYASEKTLLQSIWNKILTLPNDTIIYPGHGPASTVEHEKKNNPFL
jgi:glyoxylase-like metal-dependent hydrolase (beta-lactamase superfamily II)